LYIYQYHEESSFLTDLATLFILSGAHSFTIMLLRTNNYGSCRLFRYLILYIFIACAFIWFPRHSEIYSLQDANDSLDSNFPLSETKLWASFMESMILTRPEGLSAKIDIEHPKDININDVIATTKRLDIMHMSEYDIGVSKVAHKTVVNIIPNYVDLVRYQKQSRGIVMVGGGSYSLVLLISLRLLRRTSTLPVEVFLPSEDDYDFHFCEVALKQINARCIIFPKLKNFKIMKYQYKSFALLFCTFEDVLFLDADDFAVSDPSELFDTDPYLSSGLVTWPDYWASTISPLYYVIAGQEQPSLLDRASSESGQILISKKKHADTLLLTLYYNIYGPSLYYDLLSQNCAGEGDKETFIAAAKVFNNTFYQVREAVGAIGFHGKDDDFHGLGMIQYHPIDDWKREKKSQDLQMTVRQTPGARVIFIHQNMAKMHPDTMIENLQEKRMWGSLNQTMERFGMDLESIVWELVIFSACNERPLFKKLEMKEDSCKNLRKYWKNIVNKDK
jgi:alpha 1,2-mannosyltransferase